MLLTLINEPLTNYFPIDLIRYITPFTYKELPTDLLIDIQSFQTTKEIITSFYFEKYNHLFEYEKEADLNWLTSDILTYSKRQKLKNHKYFNSLYIKSFLINPKKKECFTLIVHKLWANLSPDDRENFIKKIKK
jgi:hypothetical protein